MLFIGDNMEHKHEKIVINQLCSKLYGEMSRLYKVIGDPTRLRILYILNGHELCVHEIVDALSISQSLASHQLRVLKNHRLVKSLRRKNEVVYSLNDEHVKLLIDVAIEHIVEKEQNNENRI